MGCTCFRKKMGEATDVKYVRAAKQHYSLTIWEGETGLFSLRYVKISCAMGAATLPPGQRTKRLPVLGRGFCRGDAPRTEFCQSRFQPDHVLRRVFRGEHQHKVAGVGIFALHPVLPQMVRPLTAACLAVPLCTTAAM